MNEVLFGTGTEAGTSSFFSGFNSEAEASTSLSSLDFDPEERRPLLANHIGSGYGSCPTKSSFEPTVSHLHHLRHLHKSSQVQRLTASASCSNEAPRRRFPSSM